MKIAILGTRGIPARYGGFETFAEKLGIGLVARGHEVTVYCEEESAEDIDCYHGIRLKRISAPALGPLSTIVYDLKCLWAARKDYHVVQMLGYGAATFCFIPRLWGTRVWINPDGLEWARAKWGRIAKLYFRLMEWTALHVADLVIADAHAIAKDLANRHRTLPEHAVIAYGCEILTTAPLTERLSEWKLTPGNYYVVVCRLEPENHVLEILKAFQHSTTSKHLVVVGNHLAGTPYTSRLREVRDDRIHMIGTVFDELKLRALRYHSFGYIHGHSVGGTNPSLLEAMGCGNLILAHDNTFNHEVLDNAGLFFGNSAELVALIKSVESSEIDAELLRSRALARAKTQYTWPRVIDSYAALLENSTKAEVYPLKVQND